MEWVQSSKDIPDLLARFKEEEVTHILYNKQEGDRLARQYSYFHWANAKEREMLNDFMKKYTRLVYTKNDTYLYKLIK